MIPLAVNTATMGGIVFMFAACILTCLEITFYCLMAHNSWKHWNRYTRDPQHSFYWRCLQYLTLFYSLTSVMKSTTMKWVGHVARMEEITKAHEILVGTPEWRRPLGRHWYRW